MWSHLKLSGSRILYNLYFIVDYHCIESFPGWPSLPQLPSANPHFTQTGDGGGGVCGVGGVVGGNQRLRLGDPRGN